MKESELARLLERFRDVRVAVVGDFCLDLYLEIDAGLVEPSLETGRPAHQVVAVRSAPGAAGTIVNNLVSLGAGEIHAVGVIGADGHGWQLRHGLEAVGCRTDRLAGLDGYLTPTYIKPREHDCPGLDGERERYDIMNRQSHAERVGPRLIELVESVVSQVDAVIVLDQVDASDCGNVTASVREALSELARHHQELVFWADSRSHVKQFRDVIIKPNLREATGRSDWDESELGSDIRHGIPTEILAALSALRQQARAPVFLTCGAGGLIVSDPQPVHVPGVRIAGPVDVTGAGDSVTASAVLSLAAGASLADAALVGNLVASITIQQLATTGVARPEEVVERLGLWHEQHGEGAWRTPLP